MAAALTKTIKVARLACWIKISDTDSRKKVPATSNVETISHFVRGRRPGTKSSTVGTVKWTRMAIQPSIHKRVVFWRSRRYTQTKSDTRTLITAKTTNSSNRAAMWDLLHLYCWPESRIAKRKRWLKSNEMIWI